MTEFIPRQDADALAWMQVFAAGITSNSALYMLTLADALTIINSVNSFDAL